MNESKLRRLRDRSGGAITLISEDCKISGNITGSSHFQVSGEIEGNCKIDGCVTLLENGRWQGTIEAEDIIIAGQVDGDVCARGRVEISQTAKINGTVSGEAIAVAEGAVVEGAMKTTGQPAPIEFVEKRRKE